MNTESNQYSKYFRDVSHLKYIDVYRVLELFEVNDHAIGHAAKKLLLAGNRTGNKPMYKDIKEARDTLDRWLNMREEDDRVSKTTIQEAHTYSHSGGSLSI